MDKKRQKQIWRKASKKYYWRHRNWIMTKIKVFHEKNAKRYLQYQKRWRELHRKYSIEWYRKNPKKVKEWKEKNKEKIKQYRRKYFCFIKNKNIFMCEDAK